MAGESRAIALRPLRGVEAAEGGLVAIDRDPWLEVVADASALAGHLVEIVYSASLWDIPARPVFRFEGPGSSIEAVAAAPVAGRATWVGRIPSGTRRIGVSPTNRPGPFAFAIERIAVRHFLRLVARGLRRHPKPARSAMLTKLIGWGPEADVNLAWATGSTPLHLYDRWRRVHERTPDAAGLDRPRADWAWRPPVLLVLDAASGDASRLRATLDALDRQLFDRWRLLVLSGPVPDHPRCEGIAPDALDARLASAPPEMLVARLEPGDRLRPAALATVVERAAREAGAHVFYGDVHIEGAVPELTPGWSPRLAVASGRIARLLFARDPATIGPACVSAWLREGDQRPLLAALGTAAVVPLHRILADVPAPVAPPRPTAPAVPKVGASAAIIVPTKDQPALLRRLLASIRARPGPYEIIVVDNASRSPEALADLARLHAEPDVRVRSDDRPFNFSRLCNEAAASSKADVLVFLNDDTQVLSSDWLERLVAHALAPDVGAVGGRLTYPDGRIQHVGVLVGMGGSAGHFGALAPGDDPGWACRNLVPHEVSAVTGACLAVARAKFEAVGGFDAAQLPIELSDIDLCLKLNARGWQTIVDPAVHLMHEESASRGGATFRRLDVHDRERAVFLARWRHVVRDDPFFHPGLSLYRWQAALG